MMLGTMSSRHRLRVVSWIAIFAIVASVLAPVASRTMAAWAGSTSPWDEICTSLGLNVSTPSADHRSDPPTPPGKEILPGACPYCLPSAQPVGLPAQPAGIPPATERGISRFLFFFIGAPNPPSVPDSILPRAPPRFV